MSEPTQPTRAVCFGTGPNEPGRECALPEVCSDSNRCVVEELRGRGWAVVPPVAGPMPPLPLGLLHDATHPLTPPEPWPGWQWCHGDLLARADYPGLFEAIGTSYNRGNEAPDQFRLPDYRPRKYWIKARSD